MIDAKSNRLNYGKLLKPPAGYELDYAVATTYSLDLEALLLIPVALFFSEDMDVDPHSFREDILEAINRVSEHITLYCQRGKIKVPKEYNALMAYWEKSLVQVQMPHFAQSFHPKVWVIRYKSLHEKQAIFYKTIVSSRNLTFSRDWDLAITTEGEVSSIKKNKNKPLLDFLKYLKKQGGKVPDMFFKELPKVEFNVPNSFNELIFHPINISREYPNPVFQKVSSRLIMSPFLDEPTLKKFRQNTVYEMYLFSSAYELSSINTELLDSIDGKFMFSPFIEEAELNEVFSEETMEPLSQNLHAKFYITQWDYDKSWFIGSANATQPATERNIEFLIELKSRTQKLTPSSIKDRFIDNNKNGLQLFETYEEMFSLEKKQAQENEQLIRKAIYNISKAKIKGNAIKTDNFYDLKIIIPPVDLPKGLMVTVRPLPEKIKNPIKIDFENQSIITYFTGYNEIDLSPFLVFEVSMGGNLKKSFVLDMDIKLDDNRLKRIFISIVNNKSKFFNYLYFLLSEEIPEQKQDINLPNETIPSTPTTTDTYRLGVPLFEKLLLTASRHPEKLKQINRLVNQLNLEQEKASEKVIPEEFIKLWENFKPFIE